MSMTMTAMHKMAMRKGKKVDRRRITVPLASVMLKLLKVGIWVIMLAPLVTGPRACHWKTARMISAKPRVAMAR